MCYVCDSEMFGRHLYINCAPNNSAVQRTYQLTNKFNIPTNSFVIREVPVAELTFLLEESGRVEKADSPQHAFSVSSLRLCRRR